MPYEVIQAGLEVKTAVVVSLMACFVLGLAGLGMGPVSVLTRESAIRSLGVIAVFASLLAVAPVQLRQGADHVRWDVARARFGLEINRATAPDAVIAVASASAIVYFADRSAVDLLGKSDPVIATGSPRPAPFLPGHNKWDYAYSIGHLQPDLVAEPVKVTSNYDQVLREWGYVEVLSPVYMRAESTRVDPQSLRQTIVDWRGACPWVGTAPCERTAEPAPSPFSLPTQPVAAGA